MKTSQRKTIGVIGATGKTGSRVSTILRALDYPVKEISRSGITKFDWNKPEHWPSALKNIDTLYVTYQPDLAVPKAESDINNLITQVKQAGVQHLVLLSGRGEEGAELAERQVINSGLSWNVVRASWFMQNFSESFMLDGIVDRTLVLPKAKALEPFIDVDDIADVVVASITREELRNQLFEITGPELLSFETCVETIGSAIGETIAYHPTAVDDYITTAKKHGMPDDVAWLMRELFTNVLDGRNAHTTNTIQSVLGREPKSFADYVANTVGTNVWSASTSQEATS